MFASADELQHALQIAGRDFLVKLRDFHPHIVGFRLEAGGFETVRELVAVVRRNSDATVILGGPTATSHPLETLVECDADFVFAGDAEAPLAAFLRAAYRAERPRSAAGYSWLGLSLRRPRVSQHAAGGWV